MKSYMCESSPKSKWENISAKSIICDLEDLGKYLESLQNAPVGPFTFVPKDLFDYATGLPEYPEFERMMKKAYGSEWKLVPLEQVPKEIYRKREV